MKNKTQILATDLVASFISTNFIKNEILGNYGHDFCKSLQGLDTNILNRLPEIHKLNIKDKN